MPRYYKKRPKKLSNQRRRPRRSVFNPVRSLSSPVPKKMQTYLRYVDQITINPGIGVMEYHAFKCNDIYDPDSTGVGHQPLGHDQYAALYKRYKVISSKFTVLFTATTSNVVIGLIQNSDTSLPTAPGTFMEQPHTRFATLTSNTSSQANKKLSVKWSQRQLEAANRVTTDIGSSPALSQYFHVGVGSIDGSADPSGVYIQVVITYLVEFVDPIDLGQS